MKWSLTSDTYWRREGAEVVLVNRTSAVRLNRASTSLFESLLRRDREVLDTNPINLLELIRELQAEGMIEHSESGVDANRKLLGHIP